MKPVKLTQRQLRGLIREAIQHKPLGEAEGLPPAPQQGSTEYDEVLEGMEDRLRSLYVDLAHDDGAVLHAQEVEEAIEMTMMGFIDVLDRVGREIGGRPS